MCSAALTCAQPRPTDAIERGRVEKAPTATGELPDGVRGKRAQFDLGSGRHQGEPRRGKCESTECRPQDERVVGKVTSPASAGGIGLGSCVIVGRTGPRTSSQTGACVRVPTSWPLLDRAAGMRNRTKRREHSDRVVPAFEAVSGEQGSIHRPRHAAGRRLSLLGQPFGEQRSILGGRSRVWDEPSSFLGTKHWKKPETELSIVEQPSGWKGSGACPPRSLTPMRQQCDRG